MMRGRVLRVQVFVECQGCAQTPGAVNLCASCVTNRNTISDLHAEVSELREDRRTLLRTLDALTGWITREPKQGGDT